MNQKIIKLVRQALKESSSVKVESVIASIIDDHGIVEIPNNFAEKFAELLVRECAKTIRDSVQTMERGKLRANIAHAATLIEEHFGVKK